jgi:hypothetical protein
MTAVADGARSLAPFRALGVLGRLKARAGKRRKQ